MRLGYPAKFAPVCEEHHKPRRLADVDIALDAIGPVEAMASLPAALKPPHMILCDDGGNVVLRLHDEEDASVAAVLSPVDAIGLAGELVAAAYRRPAA